MSKQHRRGSSACFGNLQLNTGSTLLVFPRVLPTSYRQRISQLGTDWARISPHNNVLNSNIFNTFILHAQKATPEPELQTTKAALERNSVQASPPHRQQSNTVIWLTLVLLGGRKSDPSLPVSQRQRPQSVLTRRAEHLKSLLHHPDRSNKSPKMHRLSPRLTQPYCQSTAATGGTGQVGTALSSAEEESSTRT